MTVVRPSVRERTSTSGKGLPDNYPVNPFEVVQRGELNHKFASFPAHVHFDPCVQAVLQELLEIVHPWRPKRVHGLRMRGPGRRTVISTGCADQVPSIVEHSFEPDFFSLRSLGARFGRAPPANERKGHDGPPRWQASPAGCDPAFRATCVRDQRSTDHRAHIAGL